MAEVRCWKRMSEVRCWMLDVGKKKDVGCVMLDVGISSWKIEAKKRIYSRGIKNSVNEHKNSTQSTKHKTLITKHKALRTQHKTQRTNQKPMKSILTNIWEVAIREINRMTSRSLYILVVLVFPVLSTLFFASLFNEGVPTELPIAVVDLDQTSASRRIARNIDISPLSHITEYLQSETEAMAELRTGNIYGFVVIPKNLQSDILASRQPVISYYYQNGFLNSGGLIRNNLATVLRTLSAGINIQKREAMGESKNYILQQVQPVQLSVHQLFNPTSNYTIYIASIVMPIMLQLFILLITVYSIGIEIKEKTSHEWLHFADKSIITAITGKLLPYTVIFYCDDVSEFHTV
jgi:ABC-2 type transport system permease protein